MDERKVVLITGGAMGQGRAHAYKYAENGFDVVLADMQEPTSEAFKETIAHCKSIGAKVLAVRANITSTEDMENLFKSAWDTFGRIDVVIANAGVINFAYTWELTDEQVEKVININLIGTWRTDKYAAQYMLKQGFGRIINISSTSGLYGTPKLATYCMSKWGILGLTKTLAKEVGSKGIIVNALCPTKVKTPIFWVLVVMFIFANAAGTMMVSATSPIAQKQIGLNAMGAALCVSLMTLFNMFGRISFGFIYDKLKGWNSLILVLLINGISMLMLTMAHSYAYFILCIALVGFSFGGLLVVFAPMVKIIFGSKYYNRNYGLIFIGYGIGAFVGPKISASFFDATGSYVMGYIGSAILAALAIVLVLVAKKLQKTMN